MSNAPELSPELFAQLWGEALQLYPDARVVPGLACTEVARMAYFAGWEARGTAEDSSGVGAPPAKPIRTALERLLKRLDETMDSGDPVIPAWSDSYLAARAELERLRLVPVAVSERLPELRGIFERILCVARSSGQKPVGNIELADRLIKAVVSWGALPLPSGEATNG